jgi:hypothetical protein
MASSSQLLPLLMALLAINALRTGEAGPQQQKNPVAEICHQSSKGPVGQMVLPSVPVHNDVPGLLTIFDVEVSSDIPQQGCNNDEETYPPPSPPSCPCTWQLRVFDLENQHPKLVFLTFLEDEFSGTVWGMSNLSPVAQYLRMEITEASSSHETRKCQTVVRQSEGSEQGSRQWVSPSFHLTPNLPTHLSLY